jgi:predicted NBD/HSP70 family sugar kinase
MIWPGDRRKRLSHMAVVAYQPIYPGRNHSAGEDDRGCITWGWIRDKSGIVERGELGHLERMALGTTYPRVVEREGESREGQAWNVPKRDWIAGVQVLSEQGNLIALALACRCPGHKD